MMLDWAGLPPFERAELRAEWADYVRRNKRANRAYWRVRLNEYRRAHEGRE